MVIFIITVTKKKYNSIVQQSLKDVRSRTDLNIFKFVQILPFVTFTGIKYGYERFQRKESLLDHVATLQGSFTKYSIALQRNDWSG